MEEKDCVRLLEEHDIKPTANRIVVVRALCASMLPQSLAELEHKIATIDKSNIFRALTLFREHHLVHAIEGNDADIVEINHFLQWGQVPLIIRFEEWALKPSGNWMSGISA